MGETAVLVSQDEIDDIDIAREIVAEGRAARLVTSFEFFSQVANDPRFRHLSGAPHFSREAVRPYYCAWAVQKASLWAHDLNRHLLILEQVGEAFQNS